MANRRQHTNPQFYLKQFLSPGFVYRLGEDTPRATESPSNVAVQRDYYGRDKASKHTLDGFNSWIESNGAPVLRKLVKDPSAITSSDILILSCLLANFAVRTPAIIQEMRNSMLGMAAQAKAMAEKMTEKLDSAITDGKKLSSFLIPEIDNSSPSMTIDELNKYADQYKANGGHRFTVQDAFYALPDIAECIQKMSFWVVEAPNNSFFLTSDTPLTLRSRVTNSRVGAGWQNSDAMGSFAISPRHFLIMCYVEPIGIRITSATSEQTEGLNLETIMFAYKEIYSPYKHPEADCWMKRIGRWIPQG